MQHADKHGIYWFCLLALHVPHLLGTVTYCCRMVLIQCECDRGVYSIFRHSKYCHSVFQNRRCCLWLQLRSAGPTLPQSRPTLQKIPLFTGCFQLEYSFLGDTNCLRTYFSSSRFNVTSSPWRGLRNVPAVTYFNTRCLLCVPASMSDAVNAANKLRSLSQYTVTSHENKLVLMIDVMRCLSSHEGLNTVSGDGSWIHAEFFLHCTSFLLKKFQVIFKGRAGRRNPCYCY